MAKSDWVITVKSAAKDLNMTENQIRKLCHKKKIEAKKYCGIWLISYNSLKDFKKQGAT